MIKDTTTIKELIELLLMFPQSAKVLFHSRETSNINLLSVYSGEGTAGKYVHIDVG